MTDQTIRSRIPNYDAIVMRTASFLQPSSEEVELFKEVGFACQHSLEAVQEAHPDLPVQTKKELAKLAAKDAMMQVYSSASEAKQQEVKTYVSKFVPQLIDFIVDISNGRYDKQILFMIKIGKVMAAISLGMVYAWNKLKSWGTMGFKRTSQFFRNQPHEEERKT